MVGGSRGKNKDEVVVMDTPSRDWNRARMMGLRSTGCELRARSDEARNLGSTTKENEDRDKDQGDKMEQTRILDCQMY